MPKLYKVEEILDKKEEKGEIKYLIKWLGWPKASSSCEPTENLKSIKKMIRDFELNNSKRKTNNTNPDSLEQKPFKKTKE